MIKIKNLSKTFNKGLKNKNNVIKNISLEFPQTGLIAIFGKSGSGKTTLLNILGGLLKPDSGTIYINNRNFTKIDDQTRNKEIGIIFQNYYLENDYTISEIIENQLIISGIKDKQEINRRILKSLSLVKMEDYINRYPNTLSGGQKQRVAIARAISKGANIILADEPTGNLDSENTKIIMDILKTISRKSLVILVTHEKKLISEYADSTVELVDGEVIKNSMEISINQYYENFNIDFQKSNAKHTGRLFNLKRISKHIKTNQDTLIYSLANIFKQFFFLSLSIILVILSLKIFDISNIKVSQKAIKDNAMYTSLNFYSKVLNLDKTLYDDIDFFELEKRKGTFFFDNIPTIENFTTEYIPTFIKEDIPIKKGRLPKSKEVVITDYLATKILKHLGRTNQNVNDLLFMSFENEYKIVGITNGESDHVYFTKLDYVNFLQVYSKVRLNDIYSIFFKEHFKKSEYTMSFDITDEAIEDNQAILYINRNSLYKMVDQIELADFICANANLRLKSEGQILQVVDSILYVKKLEIIRESIKTDLIIKISPNALKNIFTSVKPNIDKLKANNTGNDYFFEISTSKEKFHALNANCKTENIHNSDILSIYYVLNQNIKQDEINKITIFILILIFAYLIYYFIAKSESIKNSKEYGIYRAIGVSKKNLLYKELVTTSFTSIISYSIFYLIGSLFTMSYYLIIGINPLVFLGIGLCVYLISVILILAFSVIPYLFIVTKMPADILVRYDI